MSSITRNFQNIEKEGPILEVHFLVPEKIMKKLKDEDKPIPAPVIITALIDTGASNCVIQEDIPKKLNLEPINTVKINTPSCDNYQAAQYYLRMIIPGHNAVYEGVFTAAPLKGQDIDCLIGRDLLKHAVFIYTGYVDQFTLSL